MFIQGRLRGARVFVLGHEVDSLGVNEHAQRFVVEAIRLVDTRLEGANIGRLRFSELCHEVFGSFVVEPLNVFACADERLVDLRAFADWGGGYGLAELLSHDGNAAQECRVDGSLDTRLDRIVAAGVEFAIDDTETGRSKLRPANFWWALQDLNL